MAILVRALASGAEPQTYQERVHFPKGATRTVLSGSLGPGEARNYLLGARKNQFLTVRLAANGPNLHFNVLVPGGSMLYESVKGGADPNQYTGQLYKNGDHTVSLYNNGSATSTDDIEFVIESPSQGETHGPGKTSRTEQACLDAVSQKTGEPNVTVLRSDYSEANSLVMVGVGPQRALWRCLVSNDGVVAEISFEGSEGGL